jgi:tellurite resistance protein
MSSIAKKLEPFRSILNTELASVLMSYPACAVACVDGKLDRAERMLVLEICETFAERYPRPWDAATRLGVADRYALVMQLMIAKERVDGMVLDALRDLHQQDAGILKLVEGLLDAAAARSQSVSDVERREIQRIMSRIRA